MQVGLKDDVDESVGVCGGGGVCVSCGMCGGWVRWSDAFVVCEKSEYEHVCILHYFDKFVILNVFCTVYLIVF